MADTTTSTDEYAVVGSPKRGVLLATLGFFAGLTTIVFYGAAGPVLEERLGLSGVLHGLLLGSPHLSKAILRIPFGAWVDDVGGKKPFLVLLGATILGVGGLVVLLVSTYPDGFDMGLYPLLLLFGLLAGAGGATFSVGITQTSYWAPADRQGFAMGAFAGAGNVGPGVLVSLMPVLIGVWGLTGAYATWFVFLVAVSIVYAAFAVDPYYFQLLAAGRTREEAERTARELGQDVFPSGGTWESLRTSASIRRTWVLVFLYTVSFGGGFTALSAWFPTYWNLFHGVDLATAGLLAGVFVVYGSLVRIPGGRVSDRFGGTTVAVASFLVMAAGAAVLTVATAFWPAVLGMLVLGTGMGVANAAVFELVPTYVPEAVGGASGWISGLGGGGTLVILPLLGYVVDVYGRIGYARGFALFVALSLICSGVAVALKVVAPAEGTSAEGTAVH